MKPARRDITLVRGETWEEVWTWADDDGVPFDITGYKASIEFRVKQGATAALRLGSENPDTGIVLGGTAGTIAITATDNLIAALAHSYYRYDFRLGDAGDAVLYVVAGKVTILDRITET